MEDNFTLAFGQLPSGHIDREHISERIRNGFDLGSPMKRRRIPSTAIGLSNAV